MIGPSLEEHVRQRRKELLREAAHLRLARKSRRRPHSVRRKVGSGLRAFGTLIVRAGKSLEGGA